MKSVAYKDFAETVCASKGCWQKNPVAEAGVVADLGDGWIYFRMERHFKTSTCVKQSERASEICDALGVPLQTSQRSLIFLELKTRGKASKAIKQIKVGVTKISDYGLPSDVALFGEIWHKRNPKSSLRPGRYEEVAGRKVFIRHRRSEPS